VVKLVGLDSARANRNAPIVISQPSSYLALAQLLSNLVASSPYETGAPALAHYAERLPQTRLVSENEGTLAMAIDDGYVVRATGTGWRRGR